MDNRLERTVFNLEFQSSTFFHVAARKLCACVHVPLKEKARVHTGGMIVVSTLLFVLDSS